LRIQRYSGYGLLVLLFLAVQGLLGLYAEPGRAYVNIAWYGDLAHQMHRHGFFHVWSPYPPVFPVLLYGLFSILKTHAAFLVFWKVLNVALVGGTALAVHRLCGRGDRNRARQAAFGYLLVNATWTSTVAIGLFMDQFEYVPILLMMVSLDLLVGGRARASAAVCGVGAMTKLFPGVVLPAALFGLERGRAVRYAAVFALTCLAVLAPFLLQGREMLISWLRFTSTRDAWETVWHFPEFKVPPIPDPRVFTVPFDPDHLPGHGAGRLAWLPWVAAGSMLGFLWSVGRGRDRRALPHKVLGLLLVLLIFSKGVSSYFVFWIFPLLFVCYRPVIGFTLSAVFLLLANLEFRLDFYWAAIWARHLMFAGLLVRQVVELRRWPLRAGSDGGRPGVGEPGESD